MKLKMSLDDLLDALAQDAEDIKVGTMTDLDKAGSMNRVRQLQLSVMLSAPGEYGS